MPWQPHFGGHVGNVMGCDQPRFVPIGPLLSELWYEKYFPTWRPSATLNFKNFDIWSCDCHCGPNVLLCTEFHRSSRIRPPDAHNCRMFNAPLVGSGRCHGNRIMGDMMGCDHPSSVPVGRLVGELWHFEYFPTWRPSAIVNF